VPELFFSFMGSLVNKPFPEIELTLELMLKKQGYELVELYIHNKKQLLRVTLGHKSKDIAHEDCVKFHKYINELVPEGWSIEVWSPGIDRELQTDREFQIFQGFKVEVLYNNEENKDKKIQGILKSKDHENIYLDETTISVSTVKKIKLLPREQTEENPENVTALFVEDLA